MELAYKEAQKAFKEDEVPVGCVIVKDGEVIAKAHNRKEHRNCALFHAEIECILKATKKLDNWNLKDCDLPHRQVVLRMQGAQGRRPRFKHPFQTDQKPESLSGNQRRHHEGRMFENPEGLLPKQALIYFPGKYKNR